MILPKSIGLVLFLIVLALMAPLSVMAGGSYIASITIDQLENAFAGHCPNSTHGEVISCVDALPYINAAIQKYNLKTRGQRAAYLATMAYEGGYLQYDRNLVISTQGTRSIMPATSLRVFVNANESVQKYWPGFPASVNNATIVDVLIQNKADFEPGAWWTVSGPHCAKVASRLSDSVSSFVTWETTCINGGADTVEARTAIYTTVYQAIV
ncbi:hypothetical protein EMPS_01386 [Entomortierella parvispora]|uniref:Uncharacterized protein n=1 Tax=Entomortierella parvispora TaxID=205924 RepID=A0A9P3LSX0_9FUNG|nr:hypothetical protein EMPS_01386 [Entomortierella parvispora]